MQSLNLPPRAVWFSFLLLLAICGLRPARAEWVVNSLADSASPPPGEVTLRSALANAASGESIVFHPNLNGCTIKLSIVGNEHAPLVGEVMGMTNAPSGPISYLVGYFERDYGRTALYAQKDVVLDASALPLGITLAWMGGDEDPARILTVYGDLTLKNISLRGGRSVAEALPDPDPEDDYAQLSTRARGGAVAVWGVARLEHCRLYDNACSRGPFVPARSRDAGVFGGGIYADIVQISDCVISGNRVTATGVSGGGVFTVGGADQAETASTIVRSAITGNRISGIFAYGGGVYSDGGGIGNLKLLKLENCTVANNLVDVYGPSFLHGIGYWRGGALYMSNGHMALQSCTIVANEVHGVPRTDDLDKVNLAGAIAATIGNAHAVETMTIAHSIITGNTVHESNGTVYNEDIFTGSLLRFISNGYNRIGVINFDQILVPVGVWGWDSLCRKHYPKAGDEDGVLLEDVLDLARGTTHSADILSVGVDPTMPAVLHYTPRGNAVNQAPPYYYFIEKIYADYRIYGDVADTFMPIMLGRLESHYALPGFADDFTADFEAFLNSVDIDDDTEGNQPYTDPDGTPILTLADAQWFGPAETWPSKLYNYPYIEFWHRLNEALAAENIPGMGVELLGDDAWNALFRSGSLAENPSIRLYVSKFLQGVLLLPQDQLGTARPADGWGDIGAIERPAPTHSLLHWDLEEGEGLTTIERISGEPSVASLSGSSFWNQPCAPDSTTAVMLDGTGFIDAGTLTTGNSYLTGVQPDPKELAATWTLTSWIRLSPRTELDGDRILASSNAGDGTSNWHCFIRQANDAPETLGFDFAGTRVETALEIPLETDVFVAVIVNSGGWEGTPDRHRLATWDGTRWQFASGAVFSPLLLQGLELGASGGAAAFQGITDEVRIYGQALSQLELDALTGADTDSDGIPDILDQDDDNDGLSDEAEQAINANPKARDTDGDGVSDHSEVLAGTGVTDSTSLLCFADVSWISNQVVFSWSSASNRTYALWGASAPGAEDWTVLDHSIPCNVPVNVHTNELPDTYRIFRIGVE